MKVYESIIKKKKINRLDYKQSLQENTDMQWLFLRPSPVEFQRTLCWSGFQNLNSMFLLYTKACEVIDNPNPFKINRNINIIERGM